MEFLHFRKWNYHNLEKMKTNLPRKNFLYSRRWNFLALRLKHFLYFRKLNFLALYLSHISGSNFWSLKNEKKQNKKQKTKNKNKKTKNTHTLKIFLIFQNCSLKKYIFKIAYILFSQCIYTLQKHLWIIIVIFLEHRIRTNYF